MSKTCIIVEDEKLSADRLEKMVADHGQFAVLEKLASVAETTEWLSNNMVPDVILLDIQLSDGTGLDILQMMGGFPRVIFTTAYDQYLLDAFKFNSIDYLLKPVKAENLAKAFEKFDRVDASGNLNGLMERLEAKLSPQHKSKFLVKVGHRYHSISNEEIAYFLSESGTTHLVNHTGKKFILDQSLDHLENQLPPEKFYRVNRHLIASFKSIHSIDSYFNNRLILELNPALEQQEAIVSREKVSAFKSWLDA